MRLPDLTTSRLALVAGLLLAAAPPLAAPRVDIASLHARASHAGRYHAEVVVASPPLVHAKQRWVVQLRDAGDEPVRAARVAVTAWMPESGARSPAWPMVTDVGGGRYRLDGIRFTRPGWWNVSLVIRGDAGTDSVAFNVIAR